MESRHELAAALWDQAAHLFRIGSLTAARRCMERYILEFPEDPRGYSHLSHWFIKTGDLQEATHYAQESFRHESGEGVGHFALARVLLARERHQDSRLAASAALECQPENPVYLGLSSMANTRCGKLELAKAQAELGLAIEPDNQACQLAFGHWLRAAGRQQEASKYQRERLADRPESAIQLYELGLTRFKDNSREAYELFHSALVVRPDFRPAKDMLIWCARLRNLWLLFPVRLRIRQHTYWLAGLFLLAFSYSENETGGWRYLPIALVTLVWVSRSASNFMLAISRDGRLIEPEERLEGIIVVSLVGLGALLGMLWPALGLGVALLALPVEQFFDPEMRATRWTVVPFVLGSVAAALSWDPLYWLVGFVLSWTLAWPTEMGDRRKR